MGKGNLDPVAEAFRSVSGAHKEDRNPRWRLVVAMVTAIWLIPLGLLLLFGWPGAFTNH